MGVEGKRTPAVAPPTRVLLARAKNPTPVVGFALTTWIGRWAGGVEEAAAVRSVEGGGSVEGGVALSNKAIWGGRAAGARAGRGAARARSMCSRGGRVPGSEERSVGDLHLLVGLFVLDILQAIEQGLDGAASKVS